MQQLRNATTLARWVLVWFVLYVGAATAAPVFISNSMLQGLICSASGGSADALGAHDMKCPLCMTGGAPPPLTVVTTAPLQPLGYLAQSIPAARIAAITAAPLPPRGPPVNS